MNITVIGGADGPTSIFLAGKLGNVFFIPACMELIFFYGVYFVKQITQKRQGIRTNQLGKSKEKSIRKTEIILSVAAYLVVAAQLLSMILDWSMAPLYVRIAGVILGAAGDLVFLMAVRTMKDSWRAGIPEEDRTEFVSHGIYRYSRNPAFLGFDMMYMGILLMYFNWLLLAFTVWAVVMLHIQILQEEKYLKTVFGEEYLAYQERTGRYFRRKK